MAQCHPLMTRLVASSVVAATQAGKIIRDIFTQGDLNIVDKGVNDLQTEADRSAQNCIIESLSRQFPDITIIGEEGTSRCEVPSDWIVTDLDQDVLKVKLPDYLENVSPKDVCVWVDPLDGKIIIIIYLLNVITLSPRLMSLLIIFTSILIYNLICDILFIPQFWPHSPD